MADSSLEVTLVIPGMPNRPAGVSLKSQRFPAFELLVARGDRRVAPRQRLDLLFSLFSLQKSGLDWPVGALCHLADTGLRDDGWWMRASPIHLAADQHRVYLALAPESLEITGEEADQLAMEFNRQFGAEGWKIETPSPERWYLKLPGPTAVETTSIEDVLGHDIQPRLPRGPERLRWGAFINEIQMLFHGSPVNRQREEKGLPMINGIWLWGAGGYPEVRPGEWDRVTATDCLSRGLAINGGAPVYGGRGSFEDWLLHARGRQLVILPPVLHQTDEATIEHLQRTETEWLKPLLSALQARRVARLTIHFGSEKAVVANRRNLWRIWRRPKPLF